MLIQKNKKVVGFVAILALLITSGCATNPNKSANSSWSNCGWGALAGGVLGAGIGAATGGAKGAAIGAGAGLVAGCAAGYVISEYLNPEEKRQYDAALSQNMEKMPPNAGGTTSWQSADRSKFVQTSFGASSPLDQAKAAAAGSNVNIDQTIASRLPVDTMCRSASRKFTSNNKQVEDKGISCRDANGDWVDVTSKTTV